MASHRCQIPGDSYAALRDAYDSGDQAAIQAAVRQLLLTVRMEAKDIREKYLCPPETTEFGILFCHLRGCMPRWSAGVWWKLCSGNTG